MGTTYQHSIQPSARKSKGSHSSLAGYYSIRYDFPSKSPVDRLNFHKTASWLSGYVYGAVLHEACAMGLIIDGEECESVTTELPQLEQPKNCVLCRTVGPIKYEAVHNF